MSSKSAKSLKVCSPYRPHGSGNHRSRASPQSLIDPAPASQTSLNVGGREDQSPDTALGRRWTQVGKLVRRSVSREWKENECSEVRSSPADIASKPAVSRSPTHDSIESRLNERLIKGSQSSDKKAKFSACRQALLELAQSKPEWAGLIRKSLAGVEEWISSLQTALYRKRQEADAMGEVREERDSLKSELSRVREKVTLLTLENSKLTREVADLRDKLLFPGARSDLSSLITSLQDELRIHRRREDLLMAMLSTMREKGFPVGDFPSPILEQLPTSDSTTAESLRFDLCSATDRGNETEITYCVTPCGCDEEYESCSAEEDRAEVPRSATTMKYCDIGRKGKFLPD